MTTILAIAVACGAFLRLCHASPYEGAFGLARCDMGSFAETPAGAQDGDGEGDDLCSCGREFAVDHR